MAEKFETKPIRSPLEPGMMDALSAMKQGLVRLYGQRLQGLYLFGSYARGEHHQDSDIDTMIVLQGPLGVGEEIDRMTPLLADICLKHDVLISAFPVSQPDFETRRSALMANVRADGIRI